MIANGYFEIFSRRDTCKGPLTSPLAFSG